MTSKSPDTPAEASVLSLSILERNALTNLDYVAKQSMRSKAALKLLNKLQERGLITFDPFALDTAVTDAGRAALNSVRGTS